MSSNFRSTAWWRPNIMKFIMFFTPPLTHSLYAPVRHWAGTYLLSTARTGSLAETPEGILGLACQRNLWQHMAFFDLYNTTHLGYSFAFILRPFDSQASQMILFQWVPLTQLLLLCQEVIVIQINLVDVFLLLWIYQTQQI